MKISGGKLMTFYNEWKVDEFVRSVHPEQIELAWQSPSLRALQVNLSSP